jgi:hemolysin-activating ACP:hemolysin acyltransferase
MPIWNHAVTMDRGFMDCLGLWTTTALYSKQNSETIHWRLIPVFMNNQYKFWYDDLGRVRGFITWGWMTVQEFETRQWSGWDVFARRGGERLVIIDMIAPGGRSDVYSISRDVRKFCKEMFPDEKRVWSHRGPRNGWYPNRGG